MAWEATFDARGCAVMAAAIDCASGSGTLRASNVLAAALEAAQLSRGVPGTYRKQVLDLAAKARTIQSESRSGGVQFDALARQAVQSAEAWATGRRERVSPEHLVVVLLDQATAAGVTTPLPPAAAAAVRAAALRRLGAPASHETVLLVALDPAGAGDREPLDIGRLPAAAWKELVCRQAGLRLGHARRHLARQAILLNEDRAVMRLADRLALDCDQRYSLAHHHRLAVERRLAACLPARDETYCPRPSASANQRDNILIGGACGRRQLMPAGASAWFRNRLLTLLATLFRLTAGVGSPSSSAIA
jgi:hypothetical protein